METTLRQSELISLAGGWCLFLLAYKDTRIVKYIVRYCSLCA